MLNMIALRRDFLLLLTGFLLACGLFIVGRQLTVTQARGGEPAPQSDELLKPEGQAKPHPFDPTDAYELRKVEGWLVRVNKKLLREQPELAVKTEELLEFQLFQITRVVPATALEKIRTVTIWVELDDPLFPCMCYHSERDWVSSHGLNPDKTHGVELSNPKNFLDWTRVQPWMVFHELAHAYHDQFLPGAFENPQVLEAYRSAKEAKLYDAVLYYTGKTERAYAMNNQMEYFAEISEAYFGTNDFYPFVRPELHAHDPKGYEMLRKAWGE
jgi:hypothetical protein